MATTPFRIFIGWDQREPEAYEVARFFVGASIPVEVTPIKLDELKARSFLRVIRDSEAVPSAS